MYTIRDFERGALILIILGANASVIKKQERMKGELSERGGKGGESVREMSDRERMRGRHEGVRRGWSGKSEWKKVKEG